MYKGLGKHDVNIQSHQNSVKIDRKIKVFPYLFFARAALLSQWKGERMKIYIKEQRYQQITSVLILC